MANNDELLRELGVPWQGLGEVMAEEFEAPTIKRTPQDFVVHACCPACGVKRTWGEDWANVARALQGQTRWSAQTPSIGLMQDQTTGRITFLMTLKCSCARPGCVFVVQEEPAKVVALMNAAGRAR